MSQKSVTVADVRVAGKTAVVISPAGRQYQAAAKIAPTIAALTAKELSALIGASAVLDDDNRVSGFSKCSAQPEDARPDGVLTATVQRRATLARAAKQSGVVRHPWARRPFLALSTSPASVPAAVASEATPASREAVAAAFALLDPYAVERSEKIRRAALVRVAAVTYPAAALELPWAEWVEANAALEPLAFAAAERRYLDAQRA